MRFLLVLPLLLALATGTAHAQSEPDPVLQHYRAYRAALERQDLMSAETEAEQALAASEARDGDGGRTGVLTLNLATVRVMQGDAAGALAPAQRAVALAHAGAPGVDPTFAELILGRVELYVPGRVGADRLSRLLLGESPPTAPSDEVFPAAAQLGAWALRNRQPSVARRAWAVAGTHASGSPLGETYGFAVARLWEGVSMIVEDLGYRGRRRLDEDTATEAYARMTEAYVALRPLAQVEAESLELTFAQRAFAEALAWRAVVRRIADGGRPLQEPVEAQGDADGMSELAPVDLTLPRCWVRVEATPPPRFPAAELDDLQLGAVVMRLRFDETGAVTAHETAARAGRQGFADAVERVASRWRVEYRSDSVKDCRMPGSILMPVVFIIQ